MARAVSNVDFEKAAKEIQRTEEEKQLWLKPDDTVVLTGDFITQLKRKAEFNDTKAKATLGLCYHVGFGVTRDFKQAAEWYQQAAKEAHPGAQNNLAHLYDAGEGVRTDHVKAHELYVAAARQNLADAQFNVGLDYAIGSGVTQDWAEARKWYEKAAKQGNLFASANLGNIFLLGRGVPIDLVQAREFLEKPAKAGIATAQYSMAATYVPESNNLEAAKWMRLSAEGGYPPAQLELSIMIMGDKTGSKVDFFDALKWARKAAAVPPELLRGSAPKAHAMVANILVDHPETANGTGGPEAFREANAAAESGLAWGQRLVATCYHRGTGTERDLVQAMKWYRLAAGQKDMMSAETLAVLLDQSKDSTRDPVEAAKWYQLAATLGSGLSAYQLGLLYRDGKGVEANPAISIQWLRLAKRAFPNDAALDSAIAEVDGRPIHDGNENFARGVAFAEQAHRGFGSMNEAVAALGKAADIGHPKAAAYLARIYRRGDGVPRDEARAEALIAKVEKNPDPITQYLAAFSYLPDSDEPLVSNVDRVLSFLRRSSAQGCAQAQNALGYYFMSAPAGQRDLVEAFQWLSLAVAARNETAPINLKRLRSQMTPAQIAEGERRAREFKPHRENSTGALAPHSGGVESSPAKVPAASSGN